MLSGFVDSTQPTLTLKITKIMLNNLQQLANKNLLAFQPYKAGKPIEELQRELGLTNIIKLASNENPLGPSKLALQAIQNASENIARYPDSAGFDLKQALAQHLQIHTNRITLGAGSENILAIIAATFAKPGYEIIIPEYSFATFTIITWVAHATPVYSKTVNWQHDLTSITQKITDKTRLIFIANPNNPTGTWFTEKELIALLTSIPKDIFVVVDEAYYEYVEESEYPNTLKLQELYPNLIITRTFSKIYGLAGLRIGYSISHPDITEFLNRARLPFNISSIGISAAAAALCDHQHVLNSKKINQQGLNQLADALQELELSYIPSVGNFITFNTGSSDSELIYHDLLKEGIIVRPLKNYAMPEYLRVTAGLEEENARFIEALRAIKRK